MKFSIKHSFWKYFFCLFYWDWWQGAKTTMGCSWDWNQRNYSTRPNIYSRATDETPWKFQGLFFGVSLQYFWTFLSAGRSFISKTRTKSRSTHSLSTYTRYINPWWHYQEKNQTSGKYKREPFYSLRRCQLWFVFRRQRHHHLHLMSSTCRPYSGTKETK